MLYSQFRFMYVLTISTALSVVALCNAITFEINDLGTLHTDSSEAIDLNDQGQICGTYMINSEKHFFIFSQDTGVIPIDLPETSVIKKINNLGQIIGDYIYDGIKNGPKLPHGFIWSIKQGLTDIGHLPGHNISSVYDLNNAGQVVGGSASWTTGQRQAFIWQEGAIAGLEVASENSMDQLDRAEFINDRGSIFGFMRSFVEHKNDLKEVSNIFYSKNGRVNKIELPFKAVITSIVDATDTDYLICNIALFGEKKSGLYAINIHTKEIIPIDLTGTISHLEKRSNDKLVIVHRNGIYQPKKGWFGGLKGWDFIPFTDCVPELGALNSQWKNIEGKSINNKNEIVGIGINIFNERHAIVLRPKK